MVQSYVLLFRNGAIEAVLPDQAMEKTRLINPSYEGTVRQALKSFLPVWRDLGVMPPYVIALSLVNVAGFTMSVPNSRTSFQPPRVIDQPHLLLPEIIVDAEPDKVDGLLKPAFDLAWNACGYFGSPNFDEHGRWKERGKSI